MPEATVPADGAATGVEDLLRDVFTGIGALRETAAALHRRAAAAGRAPTTADLAAIRPIVLRQLAGAGGRLAGTGVIAAPGALGDRHRWLEWWRVPGGDREPRRLSVDLDPHSVGAYEYPAAEWFDVPRRTGRRVVTGPYVDYAGTDEYILTFAVPVRSDAGFLGVAAADIRATDFERTTRPMLDAEGPATLLVNASGRIIASNTPEIITGSLLPPGHPRGSELPRGREWADCSGLPWSLARA